MKILVTGGGGFIGSSLCVKLLKDGHTVTCLDNFSSSSRSSLRTLEMNDRFKVNEQDVRTELSGSFDEIYHLAAPASPRKYLASPIETSLTITQGTLNALKLATTIKARILIASTSEIYGDPLVSPQPESYTGNVDPTGPRSCYVEAKRYAESLTTDFGRENKTDIRIARIFNAYGPEMDPHDGRVVSSFLRQAMKNEPITIYGNGKQTRSFCYIDDLVNGLISLMTSEQRAPVNIGNPEEISITALANKIITHTGSESILSYIESSHSEPKRRCPDIKKAESFGWKPSINLDEGLIKAINYLKVSSNL